MARTIYIFCPPVTTGGPEALHQLAAALLGFGAKARVVYTRPTADVGPSEYAGYGVIPSPAPPDSPDITIVVPELWPDILDDYPRARKIFWWLSWDNGAQSYTRAARPGITHACQSRYAADMIRRQPQPAESVVMLSDYTNLPHPAGVGRGIRQNVVAYNPVKGMPYTAKLMRARPHLRFEPLASLDKEGVATLLARSKVYVDLGHHPGKDRLPREAASHGCCVFVRSAGSAAYREDVPIPHAYVIDLRWGWVKALHAKITQCMNDYDSQVHDFDEYRSVIGAESAAFLDEVRRLFAEECGR